MRKLVCAAVVWAALTQWASAGCTLELFGEFTVEHGRAITMGRINGKPVRVLINTGASLSFVERAAVPRLGLQLSDTDNGFRAFGSAGEAKVHVASVRSLQIGTFEWTHFHPYVVDDEERSADAPEFVLGDDVLSNFETEFDLAHDKIRLFYMQGCQINQVAYWAHAYSFADLDKLDPENPQIIARVLVNAKPIGARLISGTNVSMISREASERAGVTPWIEHPRGHISWIGAQPMDDWLGTFDTLSIGSETMSHVPLIIADLYKVAEPASLLTRQQSPDTMLLGMDFFMAHRMLVMPDKRKMVFTYNGGPVFRTKIE